MFRVPSLEGSDRTRCFSSQALYSESKRGLLDARTADLIDAQHFDRAFTFRKGFE